MDTNRLEPRGSHGRSPRTFVLPVLILAAMAIGGALWGLRFPGGGAEVPAVNPMAGRIPGIGNAADTKLNLDGLTIPREEILDGGPGKDGIPALTDPERVPVDRADFLGEDARVVGVAVGEESRAYPIALLNWHEVINDRLGGRSIAVVYCPLCDSASVVDRTLDGVTYEFGVSGLLTHSNVLLYDRTDDALWSQIGFEAISGPNAGRSLEHLGGWELSSFGEWKGRNPSGTVVSFATGHFRDYARNPYEQYFAEPEPMPHFSASIQRDDRLPAKERVIGVRVGEATRAYPVAQVAESEGGILRDRLGGGEVVLSVDPGTGATRVVEVPDGAQAVHTFWYAWAGFHPETELFGARPAVRK